jgi:RND family efflux transporter MFP subunit
MIDQQRSDDGDAPGTYGLRYEFSPSRTVPLLLLSLLPLWGCGGEGNSANAQEAGTENGENGGYSRVINVEVSPVRTSSFTELIRLTGTVQANQDVRVSAEESGVVEEILVEKGNRVRPGEAIFRLDDELLRAQVEQARAQTALARETWERRKRLYEEDRVGTELEYLQARYNAEQAEANLELLEARLRRTTIRAPIHGVLDSREVEVGSMVSAGSPVAHIVELDPVKITAGVPERYAPDVQPGAEATVTFDVLPGEEFRGEISYVGAVVNSRNRTFPVEFVLPNPGGLIKPEMVANVRVVRRTMEDAVVVPQEALVRIQDGYQVFVVEEEEGEAVALARTVEPGPAQNNRVVIRSGLEPGEKLIVVGQQSVASKDRVNVVEGR